MRRIKLTVTYNDTKDHRIGPEVVQRVLTLPVPWDKEDEVFEFEGLVNSKAEELKIAVISSNVNVLIWEDDEGVPTDKIAQMNLDSETDTLVITSPRLPDESENMMVFCPLTMEKFIESGQFAEIFKSIRERYESLHWSGSGDGFDLIIYYKNGKTDRYKWNPKL